MDLKVLASRLCVFKTPAERFWGNVWQGEVKNSGACVGGSGVKSGSASRRASRRYKSR